MTATQYQQFILPILERRLEGCEIIKEWSAFRGINYQYSPRVDIAVGPFSMQPYANQMDEYNRILTLAPIDDLLNRIYQFHVENIGMEVLNELEVPSLNRLSSKNQNARCFIAIEIENTSTKKHILGSMVNAASLGRIGLGIAYNQSVMRTFLRILNYLAFLKRVKKNTYDTTNFMILTKDQLQQILNEDN